MKNNVRRKDREGEAGPHDGFICMGVEVLPAPQTADRPHFKKNQCDRKAARHPLPVLLDFSFENEDQRNRGRRHPQCGVGCRSDTERAGIAHPLLEVLDIKAEWRCDEHTRDIDSADYTVEPLETVAKPVEELYRSQQQGAGTGKSMWQQPPLKGLVMLPYRILRIEKET